MTELEGVYVVWVDSEASSDWTPLSELSALPSVLGLTHTLGLLVEETDETLTLALSFDPETDSVNNWIRIPQCAVIRMETLCQIPMKQINSMD